MTRHGRTPQAPIAHALIEPDHAEQIYDLVSLEDQVGHQAVAGTGFESPTAHRAVRIVADVGIAGPRVELSATRSSANRAAASKGSWAICASTSSLERTTYT